MNNVRKIVFGIIWFLLMRYFVISGFINQYALLYSKPIMTYHKGMQLDSVKYLGKRSATRSTTSPSWKLYCSNSGKRYIFITDKRPSDNDKFYDYVIVDKAFFGLKLKEKIHLTREGWFDCDKGTSICVLTNKRKTIAFYTLNLFGLFFIIINFIAYSFIFNYETIKQQTERKDQLR